MKLLIGAKQVQKFLQMKGLYNGKIDGILGNKSHNGAMNYIQTEYGRKLEWKIERYYVAVVQSIFSELGLEPGVIDGLIGPSTLAALEKFQNLMVDAEASPEERAQQSTTWPIYRDIEKFYGPPGTGIQLYTLPFPMKLAWDHSQTVSRISLHEKCGPSAIRVYNQVLEHYGHDEITKLRLDLFGGALNVRKMRGGTKWSTHAYGCAIDTDPENNQLRWNNHNATLDDEPYNAWWSFWEAENWVSLGRERNFDWMHVQAVRL